MRNFSIEAEGTTFQFNSMNRRRVQLFQVYIMVNGKQVRFHMHLDEILGDFVISDKVHCPPEYLKAEKLLSNAIRIQGKADVIPT